MRFPPYAPLVAAFACGSTAEKLPPDAPHKRSDAHVVDVPVVDAAPTTNPAVLWLFPADNETELILSATEPTFEF